MVASGISQAIAAICSPSDHIFTVEVLSAIFVEVNQIFSGRMNSRQFSLAVHNIWNRHQFTLFGIGMMRFVLLLAHYPYTDLGAYSFG